MRWCGERHEGSISLTIVCMELWCGISDPTDPPKRSRATGGAYRAKKSILANLPRSALLLGISNIWLRLGLRLLLILWRLLFLTATLCSYLEAAYSQRAEADGPSLGGAIPVNAHGVVTRDLSKHVAAAVTGA